ncbi:MAG: M20/M25/M40 family metallo-hydrolase [Infirmifilum sp.]
MHQAASVKLEKIAKVVKRMPPKNCPSAPKEMLFRLASRGSCVKVDLVEELRKLVSIRSEVTVTESGEIKRSNYEEAARAVKRLAEGLGLKADVVELEAQGGRIPTVIVEAGGKGSSLAFVSHYDVVPAKGPWRLGDRAFDPYEPLVINDRVYGRGSADDKSAIVASLAGLAELAEVGGPMRYKPYVVVTGDEEVGGLGVRAMLDSGYRWDRVVILDAGAEYLSVGASGVAFGWIRVRGRSGHAGYPHKAVNPVEGAVKLAHRLLENYKPRRAAKLSRFNSPPGSPVPKVWGRFSLTIFKLAPGEPEKHNRIPGEAMLGFDIRLLPEEDLSEALNEFYSHVSAAAAELGLDVR